MRTRFLLTRPEFVNLYIELFGCYIIKFQSSKFFEEQSIFGQAEMLYFYYSDSNCVITEICLRLTIGACSRKGDHGVDPEGGIF